MIGERRRTAEQRELWLIERDGAPAIRAGRLRIVALGKATLPGRPRYRLEVIEQLQGASNK